MTAPGKNASSSRMHAVMAAIVFIVVGAALAIGFGMYKAKQMETRKVSSDVLATALLNPEDVVSVKDVEIAHPSIVEFNGHLDTVRKDTQYESYVARSWYEPTNGNTWIANAISSYASRQDAQDGLDLLANGGEDLNREKIGDAMRIYYYAADEDGPASLSYRFTVGNYSAKVQVLDATGTQRTEDETKTVLQDEARALAKREETRLRQVLKDGKAPSTPVMAKLPATLAGTDVLGTAVVTASEWRGVERNLTLLTIPGYQEGALRRFHLKSRPKEVAEVTVMSFDTAASAKEFAGRLLQGRKTEMTLPADLAANTSAIAEEQFVEAQGTYGTYAVDITIYDPFGSIDVKAGKTDIVTYLRAVAKMF